MRLFTPPASFDERELTSLVIGTNAKPGLARAMNFRVYHTLRSKGSQPGYPDWTLARERVVFLELKTVKGIVSPAQVEWLKALNKAAVEAYIVRPQHVEAIKHVLYARGPRGTWNDRALEAAAELELELRHAGAT